MIEFVDKKRSDISFI